MNIFCIVGIPNSDILDEIKFVINTNKNCSSKYKFLCPIQEMVIKSNMFFIDEVKESIEALEKNYNIKIVKELDKKNKDYIVTECNGTKIGIDTKEFVGPGGCWNRNGNYILYCRPKVYLRLKQYFYDYNVKCYCFNLKSEHLLFLADDFMNHINMKIIREIREIKNEIEFINSSTLIDFDFLDKRRG